MEQIFIRLITKKEKESPANMQRAFNSFPNLDGYQKVYKPYGEQGKGFYYVPIT